MKKHINTQSSLKPGGPYCTAVQTESLIFLSGMIPLDPSTGKPIAGDIQAQTARVLENLRLITAELGKSLADAVKVTVYLTNMGDFSAVNALYAEAFAQNLPARTCVAVAALPLGVNIEIDVILEA